jgi:transcriptional regulator with XRE-family HTH domain
MEKQVHQGSNVRRFRDLQGIKQEALAEMLGEDWTQKKVSQLESKEVIDPAVLQQVANALNVPSIAIEKLDSEQAIAVIANTINNHDQGAVINYYPTFNPIDKIVELYEALVKSEREKVAILERLLEKK